MSLVDSISSSAQVDSLKRIFCPAFFVLITLRTIQKFQNLKLHWQIWKSFSLSDVLKVLPRLKMQLKIYYRTKCRNILPEVLFVYIFGKKGKQVYQTKTNIMFSLWWSHYIDFNIKTKTLYGNVINVFFHIPSSPQRFESKTVKHVLDIFHIWMIFS